MGLIRRMLGGLTRAPEGEAHPGPYTLPVSGGYIPADYPLNFWQTGRDPVRFATTTAMVEACLAAYSQTIAMCPGDHWKQISTGGRERVAGSALAKVIRSPNDYQSMSDFLLNITRSAMHEGNGLALALRDGRGQVSEVHLMDPWSSSARIAPTGEIFYALSGNPIIDARFDAGGASILVPARDVLHLRLHTPKHPLKGESPMMAVALDAAATGAIKQQQLQLYMNKARPGFVLTTDKDLSPQQVNDLRVGWNEQAKGLNSGGTPILSGGLKPAPLSIPARDAQLAELLQMSREDIALAYRVPMQILGIGETPYASTEALMQSWLASGLGFLINHLESAFDRLFGLQGFPTEYVEFNTRALQRSNFKDEVDAIGVAVQRGLYTPNEGRSRLEDLPPDPDGDNLMMQEQMVPLKIAMNPPEPAPPALPAPQEPETQPEATEQMSVGAIQQRLVRMIDDARV